MISTPSSRAQSAAAKGGLDLRRNQWLALSLTPGLGPTRARRLVEHFGAVEKIFCASLTELEAAGLRAESAQSIALGKSLALAEEEMIRAVAAGADLITPDDGAYPELLKQIYDPPLILYVRGDASILNDAGLAVVGTRHPTPYGSGMAHRLSSDLAARGIVIVSGMARGVDTSAHKGALEAKGRTIAVWGTGVDVVYPRENKKLAESILNGGGAIVSEFAMGSFAAPQNFPIRNRILSGMTLGTLVVEAGEYSGTRITARCALDQGRDVYAVPGNVTSKNAWGPNTLIKQGAKLVATWEDVWEELPAQIKLALESKFAPATEAPPSASLSLFGDDDLSRNEQKVYRVLKQDEATQIDEIIDALEPNISSSEIITALFELELAGKIRQLPGKNFVRVF